MNYATLQLFCGGCRLISGRDVNVEFIAIRTFAVWLLCDRTVAVTTVLFMTLSQRTLLFAAGL